MHVGRGKQNESRSAFHQLTPTVRGLPDFPLRREMQLRRLPVPRCRWSGGTCNAELSFQLLLLLIWTLIQPGWGVERVTVLSIELDSRGFGTFHWYTWQRSCWFPLLYREARRSFQFSVKEDACVVLDVAVEWGWIF